MSEPTGDGGAVARLSRARLDLAGAVALAVQHGAVVDAALG